MKYRPSTRARQIISYAPLAFAILSISPTTFALTPEKARNTFIWQGFQGGPENKGHTPVSILVDNTPKKVSNWRMPIYTTSPFSATAKYAVYHLNGDAPNDASPLFFQQMLNQPTVTENAVIITNRGFVTPFVITHIDRDTGKVSHWDYLSVETDLARETVAGYGEIEFLSERYCTQSQSQAIFKDDIAYLTTNYYEQQISNITCDPRYDQPLNQFTYLRAHPIRPDKQSIGREGLELDVSPGTFFEMPAHFKDQFLSPAMVENTIYTQGGGVTSSRDHTGLFSLKNTGTSSEVSIVNNWTLANDRGYVTVAPTSFWAPVVTPTKVFTFLNGTTAADYRNNIPTLTEVDRLTGAVLRTQQLYSIDFKPTDEFSSNVFNMGTGPVAADTNTLVTINNGHLIIFDVRAGNYASPRLINGNFYGQPVVAGDIIYALSRDQAACSGSASCIRAYSVAAAFPIKAAADSDWVWLPPTDTENLESPFLATNSHVFVSSDAGNTYGVNASKNIANNARLQMTYPLNGKLAYAYDTLYIAHSTPYPDNPVIRPVITFEELVTLNDNLTAAWGTHDNNIANFTNIVKTNDASVVVALKFPVDLTQAADLDINLEVTSPTTAGQVEVDQIITYQASVTNRGSLNATNVVATAIIPGAVELIGNYTGPVTCSYAQSLLTCLIDGNTADANSNTLLNGDSAVFTFDVVAKLRSQILMTVEVDGTELNPDDPALNTDNNSATVQLESIAPSPSNHDLRLTINPVGPFTVDKDRNITYQLTVTNLAELSTAPGTPSATALDVRLGFELANPVVERIIATGNCTTTNCTIARLAPGETQTFRIETKGISAGQGGLRGSVASTREEATDVNLLDNEASFENTTISNNVAAQTVVELPKASGSWDLWMLFTALGLIFSNAISLHPKNKYEK